ncbi:hypothetical protein [Aliamphritea spongicola]|nr:hypothetical protein [Aliamphritea spongicola]
MAKTALLLIDFQNDYFRGGKWQLVGTEAAAAQGLNYWLPSVTKACRWCTYGMSFQPMMRRFSARFRRRTDSPKCGPAGW